MTDKPRAATTSLPDEEDDQAPEKGTLVADLAPLARHGEMRHRLEEARTEVDDEGPTTIHVDVQDAPFDDLGDPGGPTPSIERARRASTSLWPPVLLGIAIGLAVLTYLLFMR